MTAVSANVAIKML